MTILQFTLLGLGIGALYALVAQGLVLIYRGSGVVNFAQGAFVLVGAYAYYEFEFHAHWAPAFAVVGAALVGAFVGAVVYLGVLRPMRESSPVTRVIATLAVLLVLQSAAVLRYGISPILVPSALPTTPVHIMSGVTVGVDRIIILGIGLTLTLVLFAVYRYTSFGRVSSAIAENELSAASLGHSPDRIAVLNWSLGSGLAALAGAFFAPITFLQPTNLVMLVVPALAAALLAQFRSFPIAFVGAMGIGIAESLMTRYVTTPGWSDSVPFILVILVLVARGTGLPLRSHVLDKLPQIGSGAVRPWFIAVSFAISLFVVTTLLSAVWIQAVTVTMAFMILCLSVVVLTGYAGQLSLAQFVLAGVGAFAAAKLSQVWHVPFLIAIIGGVLITMVVGCLVALSALRTRGINLAIATFGLGIVLFSLVLSSPEYAGGDVGIPVKTPTIFGWNVSAITSPASYGVVVLIGLFLAILMVCNVRRGTVGRRLLSVRSNERAAAALGVNVFWAKIFAFGIAAGLAALAGVLLSFQSTNVIPSQFDSFDSITVVTATVVGGVGMVGGAIFGATLLPGGVGTQALSYFPRLQGWLPLVSGLFLLYVLRTNQGGLFLMNRELIHKIRAMFSKRSHADSASASPNEVKQSSSVNGNSPIVNQIVAVEPLGLQVENLEVKFGGVVAVADVSFSIAPGECLGLIGPNGAGKTTVIDALTGFVQPSKGSMRLGDVNVARLSPLRRARLHLARTFQSLELFDDLTIRENLAVACDRGRSLKFLTDLVHPGTIRLSDAANLAVREFGLEDVLDARPGELSLGRRRLVAIARAVASQPSVLLLDEPAAGLSDEEVNELAVHIRSLVEQWKMAVLLVEHNIELVLAVSDRLVVMQAGKVLITGLPQEVRHDPIVLDAYLGSVSTASV